MRREAPPRIGGLGGRIALLLALVLAGSVVLAGPAGADALDDRVRAIAKELRCPVCDGESVADSNATVSVQMRAIIRQKLEAGESREEILQYFVAGYGESILAAPPPRGFTLGVWVAPIVVLLAGLIVVVVVLRGWQRSGETGATFVGTTPASTGPVLSPEDERLERELERFRREAAH